MTLSGKIERMYFWAKGLFIIPLVAWMYLYGNPHYFAQFSSLLFAYVIINMTIYWLFIKKHLRGSAIYFPITLVDSFFVFFTITYYSTGAENFYTIFYYLIGILSLYRPLNRILLMAFGFSAVTILLSIPPIDNLPVIRIVSRVFYIWLVGGLGYLISHFINSSENRLLKTLDILNERTWELESSQSMLENMYETTRTLSSILDLEQLLNEILNVARDVLQVSKCSILLVESSGNNLCIYAQLDFRKKDIFNPPKIIPGKNPGDLASHMAASYNEKLIIGGDKSKRVLELPLISHGKVLGLLQIEPQQNQEIGEKDRKNFTILANSTAVAIDNALLHMKMQELTVIDELTGLYNYRYFRLKLTDEIRRADRYHQPLSILMIDVDHFKEINDSQGHQTGNIILQEIVSIIKHSVRDVDIVSRYGGEEFMVLLPQTAMKNAVSIAERMRAYVEKSYFTNSQGQRDIRATVSIGAAIYPDGVASAEQLLIKVDQAMYQAKNSGRNQVRSISNKQFKEANQLKQ